MITIEEITKVIDLTERVTLINKFTNDGECIAFKIAVEVPNPEHNLIWDVIISPIYPLKLKDSQSITFSNKNLLDYPHIMEFGNLCMHTAEYDNGEIQLKHDFKYLKEWIDTYYVNRKKDSYYEHLVVNHSLYNDEYYSFCFTDTDNKFLNEDFGVVYYTDLERGILNGKIVNNFISQKFVSNNSLIKSEFSCDISIKYKNKKSNIGVYCILKDIPSLHNKFIIEEFNIIDSYFTQQQKDYLYKFIKLFKDNVNYVVVFCGYKIPTGELHWQVILLPIFNLPLKSFKIKTNKNTKWHTEFNNGRIIWAKTENVSYKYFFGRGAMPYELAIKKFFIIGIGAIGSIVAETLIRCGVKEITIYDIDSKEYGNICRSAYSFSQGITEKTIELENRLSQISPHVKCISLNSMFDFYLKSDIKFQDETLSPRSFLNEYDIIFDCTTDNQLMQLLDRFNISSRVVNLSITNNAQDLVCAFSPNISKTIDLVYKLLNRDVSDTFNPVGCWSPTFKASYNDIECKVQFAIKHIIRMLSSLEPLNDFYITEDEMSLKINKL